LDERHFVAELARRFAARDPRLLVGIGDDAAVIRSRAGSSVISTDVQVEGVHFQRDWLPLADHGYRAVVSALSDLAAMAADPAWIVVSLGLPRDLDAQDALLIADGMQRAARAYGIAVIGGDTSRSPTLFLSVTVGGNVTTPLTRSGGRAGDRLIVSGRLGAATAALLTFRKRPLARRRAPQRPLLSARTIQSVRRRFARPRAAFAEAAIFRRNGAHALIDVSDGLLNEAAHLARGSRTTAIVDLDAIPVDAGARAVFRALGLDPEREAATSGEEYVLLAAVSRRAADRCAAHRGFAIVGELTPRRRGADVLVRDAGGRLAIPNELGWRHF